MSKQKWLGWKDSGKYYAVGGRIFYWLHGVIFEKNLGLTSTRITEGVAKTLYKSMGDGEGTFAENLDELRV